MEPLMPINDLYFSEYMHSLLRRFKFDLTWEPMNIISYYVQNCIIEDCLSVSCNGIVLHNHVLLLSLWLTWQLCQCHNMHKTNQQISLQGNEKENYHVMCTVKIQNILCLLKLGEGDLHAQLLLACPRYTRKG